MPNLCRFAWQAVRIRGRVDVRPFFQLADSFCRSFRALNARNFMSPLDGELSSIEEFNFSKAAIRFSQCLTKDQVSAGLRALVQQLGTVVSHGRSISLHFSFGKLLAREREVRLEFASMQPTNWGEISSLPPTPRTLGQLGSSATPHSDGPTPSSGSRRASTRGEPSDGAEVWAVEGVSYDGSRPPTSLGWKSPERRPTPLTEAGATKASRPGQKSMHPLHQVKVPNMAAVYRRNMLTSDMQEIAQQEIRLGCTVSGASNGRELQKELNQRVQVTILEEEERRRAAVLPELHQALEIGQLKAHKALSESLGDAESDRTRWPSEPKSACMTPMRAREPTPRSHEALAQTGGLLTVTGTQAVTPRLVLSKGLATS